MPPCTACCQLERCASYPPWCGPPLDRLNGAPPPRRSFRTSPDMWEAPALRRHSPQPPSLRASPPFLPGTNSLRASPLSLSVRSEKEPDKRTGRGEEIKLSAPARRGRSSAASARIAHFGGASSRLHVPAVCGRGAGSLSSSSAMSAHRDMPERQATGRSGDDCDGRSAAALKIAARSPTATAPGSPRFPLLLAVGSDVCTICFVTPLGELALSRQLGKLDCCSHAYGFGFG